MNNRIRTGMWVRCGGDLGIAHAVTDVATELHVVNAAGETVIVKIVPTESVAQAAFGDIPQLRRPGRELAQKLGYL